jgi:TIR domain
VGKALSAFLSHSNIDEPQVKIVQRFLTEIGIKPWVSYDDIHNSDYDELIARQIKSKDVFLLILSNNSANSKNVQNECAFADANNKTFVIYELETTDIPEGLALRLGRKQRILAYKFCDDSLERLARLIIQESGHNWPAYSAKAKVAELKIKQQQQEFEQKYRRSLDTFRELYWNCRTRNGKHRADAAITVIDRERLSRTKAELGLTDTAISKIQIEFDRRKRGDFTFVLSRALATKMLTLEDLHTLDSKRLDCCVSRTEVEEIIGARKNIPALQLVSRASLQIDQAEMKPIDVAWFIELLDQRRNELYKTTTILSKENTDAPVPHRRKADDPFNAVESKADSSSVSAEDKMVKKVINKSSRQKAKTGGDTTVPQTSNKSESQSNKTQESGSNHREDLNIAISVSEYVGKRHIKDVFTKSIWHDGINVAVGFLDVEKKGSQAPALITNPPVTRIIAGPNEIRIFYGDNNSSIAFEVRPSMGTYSKILAFLQSFPLPIDHQPDLVSGAMTNSSQVLDNLRDLSAINSMGPSNNETILVSQVYLGTILSSLELRRVHLDASGIVFQGNPTHESGNLSPSRIQSIRKLVRVDIFPNEIRLHEDGPEIYISIAVEKKMKTYSCIVRFLKPLGIPMGFNVSHPPRNAMSCSTELTLSGPSVSIQPEQLTEPVIILENQTDALNTIELEADSSEPKSEENEYSQAVDKFVSMYASASLPVLLRKTSQLATKCHELDISVEPVTTSNSQIYKALRIHQIKGDYLGRVLVHWNTSLMRGKNGIIVFDKGVLVSNFLEKTRLMYYGNLDYPRESLAFKYANGENALKIEVDGYCGFEGIFLHSSQIFPITNPSKASHLISTLISVLNENERKARCLRVARDAIIDRFIKALKLDSESVLYLADDIYQGNLAPKPPFVDHFKVFRESFGVMPIPSEVILLLDCGKTQSLLVTAFGIHFIGKDVFSTKKNLNFLTIPWGSLKSMKIEAKDLLDKTISFSVTSLCYTGMVRFDFKKRESSFAGFTEVVHELLNLILMAADLFSRI